jgi:hypothetical protein
MKNRLLIILLFSTRLLVADNSFESWQKQEAEVFQTFQSNEDRAFMNYLKEWEWYKQGRSPNVYAKPKPQKQPIKEPILIEKHPIIVDKIEPITQLLPTIKKPTVPNGYKLIDINFFGNRLSFTFPKIMNQSLKKVSKEGISHFWQEVTQQNYQNLLERIKIYQEQYQLNGWATYLLIDRLSQQISQNSNIQTLFKWFFLIKVGIDTKVGVSQNQIVLMIHSTHTIYATHYFTINHKRYFVLDSSLPTSQLQIYKGGDNNLLAINFIGKPILQQKPKERVLEFRFKDRDYRVSFYYNQNLVDFYQSYPQIPYNYYRNMNLSNQTKQTLKKTLQPIIKKMNQIDAINFLLRLTQNGFSYKRDHEQFGKEKVMFFEETLFYPYSDCEDRAIFFAILIKELLHLDTIFIKYPKHLATAIQLNSDIKGDKVIYENSNYYITDPTYTNANIGQAMPQLKGQQIKVIK